MFQKWTFAAFIPNYSNHLNGFVIILRFGHCEGVISCSGLWQRHFFQISECFQTKQSIVWWRKCSWNNLFRLKESFVSVWCKTTQFEHQHQTEIMDGDSAALGTFTFNTLWACFSSLFCLNLIHLDFADYTDILSLVSQYFTFKVPVLWL